METYQTLTELAGACTRNTLRRFTRYTIGGFNPTHVEDATTDAVGDFASKFPRTCLAARNFMGVRKKVVGRFLRRAAARSLRLMLRQGVKGDDGLGTPLFAPLDVLNAFHEHRPDTLAGEVCPVARKAALKLIWRLNRVATNHQVAQRREGARRRFRVCVRIVSGMTLTDAVVGEYSHAQRWYDSMRKSGLLAKLELVWPGVTNSFQGIRANSYNVTPAR